MTNDFSDRFKCTICAKRVVFNWREKKVETPKKKESKTIIGGLNLKSQKVYWKQTDKGNSQAFIAFLYQIQQSFPGVLIILI